MRTLLATPDPEPRRAGLRMFILGAAAAYSTTLHHVRVPYATRTALGAAPACTTTTFTWKG